MEHSRFTKAQIVAVLQEADVNGVAVRAVCSRQCTAKGARPALRRDFLLAPGRSRVMGKVTHILYASTCSAFELLGACRTNPPAMIHRSGRHPSFRESPTIKIRNPRRINGVRFARRAKSNSGLPPIERPSQTIVLSRRLLMKVSAALRTKFLTLNLCS